MQASNEKYGGIKQRQKMSFVLLQLCNFGRMKLGFFPKSDIDDNAVAL